MHGIHNKTVLELTVRLRSGDQGVQSKPSLEGLVKLPEDTQTSGGTKLTVKSRT